MTKASVKDVKPQLPYVRPMLETGERLMTAKAGQTHVFRTTSSAAHAIGVTRITIIVSISGLATCIVWGEFRDFRQYNGVHGIDELKIA